MNLVPATALSLALLAALAGCSSPSPGPTTTSSTTSTSSTTTTTMPVGVIGTSIQRARVAPLPPGALVLPAVTEGSAAWLKMIPIAYRSFGSGPDLLLISGQDGTLSWWGQTLLSDLSGHYRVTVFDLPGAGYSAGATAPLSIAWLADMTAGFALTVGLSDPTVLGWGLGGQVALSLAERHTGFASSLVLVDTSAGGAKAVKPGADVVRLLAEPAATPVALSTALFPPTAAGLLARTSWASSLFSGPPDWMTAEAVKAEAALQGAAWKTPSLSAGLSRVTIPALVMVGADDVVFPPANASRLVAGLPHAREVSFPGAGYGAIVQDEPAFVAAVESFTAANVPPSTSTTSTTSPGS
ncbi:MAG: alpha/beta hydrolase [Acidimicrobiales bacterium]